MLMFKQVVLCQNDFFFYQYDKRFVLKSRLNISICQSKLKRVSVRECVWNLDLLVQVHPGELWVSKQRVHIVLEASKLVGVKGDVPKICGFVHLLHPC